MARHLCARYGNAINFKKKAVTNTLTPTLQTLPAWLNAEFGQHAVAIALVRNQQVDYHLHGLADVTTNTRLTEDTLFEIGSVSKPLTALAVLIQVQAGRWQLEQSLAQQVNLPQLAQHRYTLAALLTHRSGLPRLPANLVLDDISNPYAGYTEQQLLTALADTAFSSPTFSYSNFGYGLLGFLLQHGLQRDFASIMQQQVFTPLGMKTAAVQSPGQAFAKLANGYAITGEKTPNWQFDSLAGAGGVIASINDMAALLQAVFAQTEHNTLFRQWLTVLPSNDEPKMTAGWMQQENLLWHAGQTGGFTSLVAFDAEQKLGIVILSNIAIPVTTQGFVLLKQWIAQHNKQDLLGK